MSTIIDEIARTLWLQHWRSEHEGKREKDPDHQVPWRRGEPMTDQLPPTPKGALMDAGRVVGMVEERTGLQIDACWARALKRDGRDWEQLNEFDKEESKEEFGYCVAMMALGTGVSWMDDHEEWDLEVPQVEAMNMPDVFAELRCGTCGGDAGHEWENCDDCRSPVCQGCRPHPEFVCHGCRDKHEEEEG